MLQKCIYLTPAILTVPVTLISGFCCDWTLPCMSSNDCSQLTGSLCLAPATFATRKIMAIFKSVINSLLHPIQIVIQFHPTTELWSMSNTFWNTMVRETRHSKYHCSSNQAISSFSVRVPKSIDFLPLPFTFTNFLWSTFTLSGPL